MSRIGQQPIQLPTGVDVAIKDNDVTIKGPRGSLSQTFSVDMKITQKDQNLLVHRPSDERNHKAIHGLTRSLLANMVIGVSEGFKKTIELVGVGYRAQQSGSGVTLSVMLSHTVEIQPPDGVTIEVEGNNQIHIQGVDKQTVGQTAARLRAVRPPNAYTGKGIRYLGEQVRLKPGKSARRVI